VPTAFLLAGACNVIASGWPVHDAAATVLMSYVHASLDSGRGIAAALAEARQKLARTTRRQASLILGREDVIPTADPPFESPIFTDAFVNYGIGS
jgi:CHAT domain-containing protein